MSSGFFCLFFKEPSINILVRCFRVSHAVKEDCWEAATAVLKMTILWMSGINTKLLFRTQRIYLCTVTFLNKTSCTSCTLLSSMPVKCIR